MSRSVIKRTIEWAWASESMSLVSSFLLIFAVMMGWLFGYVVDVSGVVCGLQINISKRTD